jgi:predicted ATP-grasp superfamily ATP-dependent carboligase
MKVLLTDGNFKHTLAATRSLGKRGVEVTAVSHIEQSISFYSKYCAHHYILPDSERDAKFAAALLQYVKQNKFDVILPVSLGSVIQVSSIRKELERYVIVPIADHDVLDIASDKGKTVQFAQTLGIDVPKTWYPHRDEDLKIISKEVRYPAVVKGSKGAGIVRYANDEKELIKAYQDLKIHFPIVQDYIHGDGYGFFALYNRGKVRAIFMHRRIRTYPVTGGSSTFAESIYDPVLRDAGLKILNNLRWHGVAMVEFKKDSRSGKYVLMEINPKFWGTLDLSIASGVDFPYLTCKMATEGDIEPVLEYKSGVKFRWLFPGDVFNVLTDPGSLPKFICDFKDKSVRYDIYADDIRPTVMQIGMTVAELFIRIKQQRFWRPHGRPHS